MQTISLCMIVRNEEAVLERCLKGVTDIADEIIIVDTGSTDASKDIAARFTDRIYDFPWVDDFAAARNFSFSKATMDFIFWLDADDVITMENREKLLAIKAALTPDTDMVMLPYHVAFDESGMPTFTYERERIVRRDAGFYWVGAVHEVIAPHGTILHGDAAVEHHKLQVSDPDRNLRILENKRKAGEPLDTRLLYYYARELYYHRNYAEAIEIYREFFARADGWRENRIEACSNCAQCLLALDRTDDAMEMLLRSFLYDCPRAEICCQIGGIKLAQAEYEEAAYWYKAALHADFTGEKVGFFQPDYHDYIPLMQLCVCYDRMGNERLAKAYNDRAGRIKPRDRNYLLNCRYFQEKRNHVFR